MEIANIVFRLLATSQIILFLVQILFSSNPLRLRLTGVLLSIGCIGYLVLPLAQVYMSPLHHTTYLWLLPSIVPSLLLLFVWFIFEDPCYCPTWIVLVTGASILGSFWFTYYDVQLPEAPIWFQIFKVGIVVMALYVVWRGREQDLVLSRSKFRYIFIAALASLIFMSFTAEVITGFNTPEGLNAVTAGIDFVLLLVFNYFFLKLYPGMQLIDVKEPLPNTEKPHDPLISELLERMRAERLFCFYWLVFWALMNMFLLTITHTSTPK